MALPEKALEQLAREPMRTPGFSGRLLMFSATLFFLSVFCYVGLVFGYKPYLATQIAKLDQRIANFSAQVSAADQAKIVAFYSQLANLQSLLDSHILTSRLLDWMERNTQANISFSRMSINTATRQLLLGGNARTVTDAVEQIKIFQDQPEVERVTFNNLAAEPNGKWHFDLTVFLTESLLKDEKDKNSASADTLPTQ